MNSWEIRTYRSEDIEQIGKLDEALKILVLCHGDFERENMVCAATSDGRIIACGLLMPTEWFTAISMKKDPNFVHYIGFELHFAEGFLQKQVADALIKGLIQRGYEIKAQYPDKKIALARYMDTDDAKQLDFYLGHGFCLFDTVAEFQFDLCGEIPKFPKPDGITVRRGILCDPVSLEQYHMAEIEAFDGISWSISQTKWMQNAPELCNFSAYYGDEFVGNTSTWTVAPEQGVTENVFVVPKWQKQGIARFLISEALQHLKRQGKTVATLGTQGDNRKAIRLYHELGYKVRNVKIRVGYELNGK